MSKHVDKSPPPETGIPGKPLLGKLGVALILLSGVFFFAMLSVPWLPLSVDQKLIVGGALFVGVQVAWWVGAVLVGPAAISRMRAWVGK